MIEKLTYTFNYLASVFLHRQIRPIIGIYLIVSLLILGLVSGSLHMVSYKTITIGLSLIFFTALLLGLFLYKRLEKTLSSK